MIYILPRLNPVKQQPSQRGEEGGAGGRACDIKINTETSIPWQRRRFAKEKNSLSATFSFRCGGSLEMGDSGGTPFFGSQTLWTRRTYSALGRGAGRAAAAVTVGLRFYLRERGFIKSHGWNCMTGANIPHPDRCVVLRRPFPCQRSLDGAAGVPICLSCSGSHMPDVCLPAARRGLICAILTMRLIKRQSIIFI